MLFQCYILYRGAKACVKDGHGGGARKGFNKLKTTRQGLFQLCKATVHLKSTTVAIFLWKSTRPHSIVQRVSVALSREKVFT